MTRSSAMIEPTLSVQQAAQANWEAVVVGAGPSGAVAARQLAQHGASVLLVDKAAFPRWKVCGCCVNASALEVLRAVGLGALPQQLGATPLHECLLVEGRRRASIPLPSGVVVSREAFDAALIRHAIQAGVEFLPQTAAASEGIQEHRHRLVLRGGGQACCVNARVLLVANGLGGALTRHRHIVRPNVTRGSRIGIGSVLDHAPRWCRRGTIVMACGPSGYAGFVQLEDGRLNIAAALDPACVRSAERPGRAIASFIAGSGLSQVAGLDEGLWRGTPRLTHQSARLAHEQLFVLGDAAGSLEPFTGEGIAWALWCGAAVSSLALEAIHQWTPALADRWEGLYRQQVARRQWTCRLLAALLRHTVLRRAAFAVLSRAPACAGPLVQRVNAPRSLDARCTMREAVLS